MGIDWFYGLWILSLSFKFPGFISAAVLRAGIGSLSQLNAMIGNKIDREISLRDKAFN